LLRRLDSRGSSKPVIIFLLISLRPTHKQLLVTMVKLYPLILHPLILTLLTKAIVIVVVVIRGVAYCDPLLSSL